MGFVVFVVYETKNKLYRVKQAAVVGSLDHIFV